MNEPVLHSGFKWKALACCSLISVMAMALACVYPESQQAIATIAGSLNILGGAAIGGRAWQQNSYSRMYPSGGLTQGLPNRYRDNPPG